MAIVKIHNSPTRFWPIMQTNETPKDRETSGSWKWKAEKLAEKKLFPTKVRETWRDMNDLNRKGGKK